ncbi:hypothetical protein C0Q70_20073 [Pomacea canaliculata]|uniref:Uncharacterized protein n=1 Tax=Pomacea canaliculata TaxID=400727 RepID=A0A2T7NEH5_POMCA|nr:hypothetical protein C0Q70_20073 [Pomacea canaliculata]
MCLKSNKVEAKQSYILDRPDDITKNLSFIAGSVKVKVNYSSFSEQETSGQNEELSPPTGKVIPAQHTEMSPAPQCNSSTAQQHEVLASLPDLGSTIIPDKSTTAESRTAPQAKIAETPQVAGIMGPHKQEIADTEKKGAGVEQSQTSRASSKTPVASCENIISSQQYISSQNSRTGATQIGSTLASHTTMQNATAVHSVTGTELKISATAPQSSSAILGQIESTVQNKHIADPQVKSTSVPPSKNTSQNKKSPEPQVKSTPQAASQSRSTKEPKIKSTTASQSKSTTIPQSTAVLKSKETSKVKKKSTAAVQSTSTSTSTSPPKNKSAEAAESRHNMAIPGKNVAESAQSKSTADSLQWMTETAVPSERPAHKGEAISHLMEKDAQSQKKAMFVPLTLVGPPVPKLAEIKHWSSVPLSTHPAPCADSTKRSYPDRAGLAEGLENLSTDLVANDTDSSLPQTVIHQTSAVSTAMQDLTSGFSHYADMPPSSFASCSFGQSMSYAAVAQKPAVPVPPGGSLFPQASSSGEKVGKSRQRKRSRRGGKGRKQAVKVSAFEMPTSIMPSSIMEDTSSSPVTFKGSGKVPTSFAPLPNGQVWLAYGDRDPHIDLMNEDKIIERVRVGGNIYQVSCITDECIALLSQSPYPRLLLIDSTKKPSEMHVLDMKTTAFSVGFTGIAVCGYRSLLWIHLNSGAKELIVSEEDSTFIKTSSCAVMFRDGSEVICVADKGGHAVCFFEKKLKKGAITLEPYTGAGLHPSDQKKDFTPISVSAHSAGFLGILDSTTQSVLILDSKLQLTSVISKQHLCCGIPSVIAFSADSSCKLWVASEPGPLCLAPLLLLYI